MCLCVRMPPRNIKAFPGGDGGMTLDARFTQMQQSTAVNPRHKFCCRSEPLFITPDMTSLLRIYERSDLSQYGHV